MEMRVPHVDVRPEDMFQPLKSQYQQKREQGNKNKWDCQPESVGTRCHSFFLLKNPRTCNLLEIHGRKTFYDCSGWENLSKKFADRKDYYFIVVMGAGKRENFKFRAERTTLFLRSFQNSWQICPETIKAE
jgi:hypothetical protein